MRTAPGFRLARAVAVWCGLGAGLGVGQTTLAPTQVIDVRGLLRAHTLRQDFEISGIAQCNGRWAAVAGFPATNTSMVVLGRRGSAPQISGFVEGLADRITLDPSGQTYLRMQARLASRVVEILDSSLKVIGEQRLKGSSLHPIPSAAGVFWSSGLPVKSIFTLGLGMVRQLAAFPDNAGSPFDARTPDYGTMMAWTDGTALPWWVRVKDVSEEVTVFDENGSPLTRNKMDLDSAYANLGYQNPQRYPAVEAVRVGWTVVSKRGELYVRLGSVPIYRPTPLAVIDPLTGRLLRVVSILVPTSPERIDTYPQGFMHAGAAVMGDQMIVPDLDLGLLAFYSL